MARTTENPQHNALYAGISEEERRVHEYVVINNCQSIPHTMRGVHANFAVPHADTHPDSMAR